MSEAATDFAHDVDWAAVAQALGDVPVLTEPPLVKQKSRDFYWYSPILKAQLRKKFADIVAVPRHEADVVKVAATCAQWRVPLTVRGAGTGNYGQAMPLHGGVILDMTALDRIKWLKDGVVAVEAGKKLIDLEGETRPQGWELRMYGSTRRTATIGGFIAGGSGGIGSIMYGVLADRGAINALRLVTCEEGPRIVELRGDEVMKASHAYGCNGIITELEIPLAPAWPWLDCIAVFDDFMASARFCQALGESDGIVKREIAAIEWPLPQYFKPIRDVLPDGKHAVLTMIAAPSLDAYAALLAEHGGTEVYRKTEAEVEESGLPPIYEYTWNHTTLQVLKTDRTITYLQTLFAPGDNLEKVAHMREVFGEEVPLHLEFVRLHGRIGCFGLQIVRYTTPERLDEIIRYHDDNGCPVFNPHTYVLEDGGMKEIDYGQVDLKREADPHGLLNPGKMRGWEEAR